MTRKQPRLGNNQRQATARAGQQHGLGNNMGCARKWKATRAVAKPKKQRGLVWNQDKATIKGQKTNKARQQYTLADN